MLFFATVAMCGTLTAFARYVVTGFTRLSSRVIACNEHWNPWSLRRQLRQVSNECARLHNAQRIGTRVVGCLSENEIHKHYMRMMGHAPAPEISQRYIADIEAARKLL